MSASAEPRDRSASVASSKQQAAMAKKKDPAKETMQVRPYSVTTPYPPQFGWTPWSETMNGRAAMVGITAMVVTEILTGDTCISQAFCHTAEEFHVQWCWHCKGCVGKGGFTIRLAGLIAQLNVTCSSFQR
eukprot:g23937.t1